MKNIRFNIFAGLLAMYVAWFLGYVFHAVYNVDLLGYGIGDFSFIVIWSAIYCIVSLFVFVPIAVWLSNKFNKARHPFLWFSTLAGPVAMFTISLCFGLYPDRAGWWYYYFYALVVSFSFGFLYPLAYWLKDFINVWLYWAIGMGFPIVSLALLTYVMPLVFPRIAYCYFGEPIKGKALEHVIRNIEVGDTAAELNKKLPGLFTDFVKKKQNHPRIIRSKGSSIGTSRSGLEYYIEFEDYKVKTIEIKTSDQN